MTTPTQRVGFMGKVAARATRRYKAMKAWNAMAAVKSMAEYWRFIRGRRTFGCDRSAELKISRALL